MEKQADSDEWLMVQVAQGKREALEVLIRRAWPARKGLRKGSSRAVRKGCWRASSWFWMRNLGNLAAGYCREFALRKTWLRCVRYRGC